MLSLGNISGFNLFAEVFQEPQTCPGILISLENKTKQLQNYLLAELVHLLYEVCETSALRLTREQIAGELLMREEGALSTIKLLQA